MTDHTIDSTIVEMESVLMKSEEKLKILRAVLLTAQIEVTRWEHIVKIQREALTMTKGPLRQQSNAVPAPPGQKQTHTKWMPFVEEIISRVQKTEIQRPQRGELLKLLKLKRPGASDATIYQFISKAIRTGDLKWEYGLIYLRSEATPE